MIYLYATCVPADIYVPSLKACQLRAMLYLYAISLRYMHTGRHICAFAQSMPAESHDISLRYMRTGRHICAFAQSVPAESHAISLRYIFTLHAYQPTYMCLRSKRASREPCYIFTLYLYATCVPADIYVPSLKACQLRAMLYLYAISLRYMRTGRHICAFAQSVPAESHAISLRYIFMLHAYRLTYMCLRSKRAS